MIDSSIATGDASSACTPSVSISWNEPRLTTTPPRPVSANLPNVGDSNSSEYTHGIRWVAGIERMRLGMGQRTPTSEETH